jgi:CheY-like chemotaxis protein
MSNQQAPSVLVIDDEEDIRVSLIRLLECDGFRASEAADGETAIRALDDGLHPDVLLLDYRMPGLNGGQTLDTLRARGHRMPAVLLTAAKDAADIAARHGFDAVLTKPVGPEEVFSTLRDAIARAAGSQP